MKYEPKGMMTHGNLWRDQNGPRSGVPAMAPQPMFDAELGQIFIKMRSFMGLGLWDMARAVGTEPTVIADLEAGALASLPPWPQLMTLVDAYARLTGVDPQPIVSRLLRLSSGAPTYRASVSPPAQAYDRVHSAPVHQPSAHMRTSPYSAPVIGSPTGPVPVRTAERRPFPDRRTYSNAVALAAPAEVADVDEDLQLKRPRVRAFAATGRRVLQGIGSRAAVFILLAAIPALVLVAARQHPVVLYAAVAPMPAFVGNPLRMGLDQLVSGFAPVRDGLTWIDVGDPRARKADRLPEHSR